MWFVSIAQCIKQLVIPSNIIYRVCKVRNSTISWLTTPVVVLMQFILILEINLAVGASSGYLWPHSTLTEYILFSYGVRCGPIIMPIQCVSVISSSFSKPQLMVPSPTPFCPASNSSSNRKLRGTTETENYFLKLHQTNARKTYIFKLYKSGFRFYLDCFTRPKYAKKYPLTTN